MDDVALIVPPPNVRNLLEKAAARVGKKPALEAKILEKHGSDPRFAFLQPSNPYHAYYQQQLKKAKDSPTDDKTLDATDAKDAEKQEGASDIPSNGSQKQQKDVPALAVGARQEVSATVSKLKSARLQMDRERQTPSEAPPADKYTVPDISSVSSHLSLEVIKLVAQFFSRHGSGFLTSLSAKEGRNPLFDFLKPTHPHFVVFDEYARAYREVLKNWSAPADAASHWSGKAVNTSDIMNEMWRRCDWKRSEMEKQGNSNEDASLSASAAVDWHDFVVVETVEIDESDDALPAPVADPAQIPRVMAAADAARREQENNKTDVDMEMDMEMDGDVGGDPTSDGKRFGMPPDDKNTDGEGHGEDGERIFAAGNAIGTVETADVDADIPAHRVRRAVTKEDLDVDVGAVAGASRITEAVAESFQGRGHGGDAHVQDVRLPDGQVVPLSEATPAMRAQLIDRKYKEERIRAAEKNQRQNLADGEEMALHLARLNREKPDSGVYNRGDLQEGLTVRTISRPTPLQPPKPVLSGPRLPDASELGVADGSQSLPLKRARIEAAVGALTSATASKVEEGGSQEKPPVETEEARPTAHREAGTGRVSEEEWISKVGEKVEICVKVPVHSNPEWNLAGQLINMEVPLKNVVQRLKEVIAKCTRVPANKQKLQYGDAGFLSNRHTLAYYNVAAKGLITLEVKERGGKRKAGS